MMSVENWTKRQIDAVSYKVIGAAIEVHKHVGPGLLESVYQKCLFHELRLRKILFEAGLAAPLDYKNMKVDAELRCDFLVENCLVVELKSVEVLLPVHSAQTYTCMRLLNVPKGLLLNFNSVNIFKGGQRTLVNDLYRSLAA